MDLTCLLPYELLQLVSSCLLPRSQCRFAMASRHCYLYLYNDMLRWHARKDTIPVPKYKFKKCKNDRYLSISERCGKLIMYGIGTNIMFCDLTNLRLTTFISNKPSLQNLSELNLRFIVVTLSSIGIFNGCYKYMHKKCIVLHKWFSHPLLSLPKDLLDKISSYLIPTDAEKMLFALYGHY